MNKVDEEGNELNGYITDPKSKGTETESLRLALCRFVWLHYRPEKQGD